MTGSPLGVILSGRENALNFLRLLLAAAVIFWHVYPVTGRMPGWPASELGSSAVNGFFALSGYLIAGSRMRLPFGTYLLHRAARIYPAFWVCLIVTAFVFAPLSTLWTGAVFAPGDGVRFVAEDVTLWMGEYAVGDTLGGVPEADVWNASLWTLVYEFAAYLGVGILLLVPALRRHLVATAAVILVTTSTCIALEVGRDWPGPFDLAIQGFRLWSFFAAGMLIYGLRQRIGANFWVVLGAAAGLTLVWALGVQAFLAQLPLALLLLTLGALLPVRIGSRNDISYGMYIYAFPVQQLLWVSGVSTVVDPLASAALATLLTVPIAWLSWKAVEQPVMRLLRRRPAGAKGSTRRSPAATPTGRRRRR